MNTLAWTMIAFLCGSIPFSVWIGRAVLNVDIRTLGDQNPGATNVARAGGARWGVIAALADFGKAALPVTAAWVAGGVSGFALLPVALAPVMGHAFSPWLGWRGGKAVAVTFGIWAGLTWFYVPPMLGVLLLLGVLLFRVHAWAVMWMIGGVVLHFAAFQPDPILLSIALGNSAILTWKHRRELNTWPRLNTTHFQIVRRLS